MKAAFHFNSAHDSISKFGYNLEAQRIIFAILLRHRKLLISSKIFAGDLLLTTLATDSQQTATGQVRRFNREKYLRVIQKWLHPENAIWSDMLYERFDDAILNDAICTVCFETIQKSLVDYLNEQLIKTSPAYLGVIEVDDASIVHWYLYSNCLLPMYRITNRNLAIFWDGIIDDSKDEGLAESLNELNFEQRVEYESLNGRYTIFDEFHDFEHARRIAEWKRGCGNLLAFIADDVVHRLGDIAPDVGDRVWAILRTFEEAETNEQLAQVATSCRRIVEYISDQLFPPTDDSIDGRKLGTNQYRNRLLAFIDQQKKSNTNIDLIWVSTKTLSEQMEKLAGLAHKGVHVEIYRTEARRCLLRTVMLLDDIISLKADAFPIKAKLNIGNLSLDL